jgi:hypothetical protein
MIRCTTFTAVAGQQYKLTFTTMANSGNPTPDSPANLVLTIGGQQYWAGYTRSSTGATGNPGGINTNQLATSQGGLANFLDQTWTVTYTSLSTGPVTICFKWTAFPRVSSGSTDDIGTTVPTLACA